MISIVMTYFNRPQQLLLTLRSIQFSKVKDIEIIIVDDASNKKANMVLDHIVDLRKQIKIIEIKKEQKWWMNPCVSFNLGLKEATGDIIIIQNAECIHLNDVLAYTKKNCVDGKYISIPCWATRKIQHNDFCSLAHKNPNKTEFEKQVREIIDKDGEWFNHNIHKPTKYHFCSVITKNDLKKIGGGFNEMFASGYCFDDNFLVWMIEEKGIKIEIPNENNCKVIHQWHEKERSGVCKEWHQNRILLEKFKSGEIQI